MSTSTLRSVPPPPPPSGENSAGSARAPFIDEQIDRTRSLVKWNEVALHGVVLGAAVLAALLLLALVDHWVVGLGGWGRGLAFAAIVAGALYYLVRWIVPPLWQSINPLYAAHTIEEAQPELKNSLVNFLFFRAEPQGVRQAVLTALEERAARDLTHAPVDTAVDRTHLIQASYVLAGVLTLFALYTILSPKDPFQTIARVALPWADIARPSRVQITDIQPGDVTTYFGYEVLVSANIRGAAEGDPVTLVYSTADGQVDQRRVPMQRGDDGLRYQASLPPEPTGAEQAMTYRLVAGDAETILYRVEVLPAPSILVRKVHYDLPEYTGEPDRDVERDGDLRAIEGTRVTLSVEANQEIKSGAIEFDPQAGPAGAAGDRRLSSSDTVQLTVDPQNPKRAVGTFTLLLRPDRRTPRHRTYQVRFTNAQGDRNERPIEHAIEVLPDLPPAVEILAPGQREMEVPVNGRQAFEVRALDPDYKLTRVTLRGISRGQTLFTQPLLDAPAGVVGQQLPPPYVFRPAEHRLQPGDVVVVWAEAADNRTSPHSRHAEANVSETEKYTLKIVAPKAGEPSAAGEPPPAGENRPGQEGEPGQTPPMGQPNPNGAGEQPSAARPGEGEPGQGNPGGNSANPGDKPPQPGQTAPQDRRPQPGDSGGDPQAGASGGQGTKPKQPGANDSSAKEPGGQNPAGGEGNSGSRRPPEANPGDPNQRPGQRDPGGAKEPPMGGQKPPAGSDSPMGDPQQPSGATEGEPGRQPGQPDSRNKPMGGAAGQMGGDSRTQGGAGGNDSEGQNDGSMSPANPAGGQSGDGSSGARGSDSSGEAGADPAGGTPTGRPGQGTGQRGDDPSATPLDDSGRDDGEIFDRALKAVEEDIRRREGEEGVRKFRERLEKQLAEEKRRDGNGQSSGQNPAQPGGQPPMGQPPTGQQPGGPQPPGGNAGQPGAMPPSGQPQPGGMGQNGNAGAERQPMPGGPMGQQPPPGGQSGAAGGPMNPQGKPAGGQGDMPMAGGEGGQQPPMAGGSKPGDMQPGGAEGTGPMGAKPMAGGQDPSGMQPGGASSQPMGQQPGGAQPMGGQPGASGMNQGQGPMQSGGQSSPGGMPMGGAETQEQPMGQKPGGGQPGGMGQNGNSGGGQKPMGQQPGAPESQGGGQQGNKPEKKPGPNGGGQGGEAQSPSTSKKPSQSQGGDSGDKSGGGKQGGGQGGMQPGNDSAGGSTPGDSGAGQADQPGGGDQGKKGGMGQVANQPTGQSGNQQGEGSSTTQESGQTGPGGAAQKTPGAGQQPGQRGETPRPGQQPDGTQGTAPGAGSGPPARGFPQEGVDAPPGPDTTTPTVPDPDPEYAKKVTQLTLEYLKDQAANPDPELLKRLGAQPGDKAFLQRFVDRWEKLYRDAADPGARGEEARRELDETLRGLGLRKQSDAVRSADPAADGPRDQDAGRSRPPREYEDLYRAYNKGLRGLKTTP